MLFFAGSVVWAPLSVTACLSVLPPPSQSHFTRLLYFPPQSCFARQLPRTRGSLSGMDFEKKLKSYFFKSIPLIASHACGGGAEQSEAEGEIQGSWRAKRD